MAKRDTDISAALAGKTHFAGLDATIIGMLPVIGGGGPVINAAYFASLLTEVSDAAAKAKLEADLLISPTNLNTITQAITGQFHKKNWLATLRVMLKNKAVFDYREPLFADYLAAMKADPASPAWNTWDFHATAPLLDDTNQWTLAADVKNYVEGANWLNFINKDSDLLVKHNWKSANTIKVLGNTVLLDKLENAVFKYLNNSDSRATNLKNAKVIITDNNLRRLTVPKFALEAKLPNYYLFEERIDMNANWYFQHDLYAYLYEKAKTDAPLKLNVTKALEQLTTFVCKSSFNDVKFDNNPISKYGTIALIDPESSLDGDGPGRLMNYIKKFYTPGDYKDDIAAVINDYQLGAGQCSSANYDLATVNRADAKTEADTHQTIMEKVAQCRIKKGVIDFAEPIDKSSLATDFPDPATRNIAEEIIDKINTLSAEKTNKYEKRSINLHKNNYIANMTMPERVIRKPVFFDLIAKGYLCDFANGTWGKTTLADNINKFNQDYIGDVYF